MGYSKPTESETIKQLIREEIVKFLPLFERRDNTLKETLQKLYESKKTEREGLNILKKNSPSVDENRLISLIDKFKEVDTTKNEILIPFMATMYGHVGDIDKVETTTNTITDLIKRKKINNIFVNNNGEYVVNDKTFGEYLNLTEYLHGLEGMERGVKDYHGKMMQINTDEKPLFENKNVVIYDGNEVGRCIKYNDRGLTGRKYSFCIGDQHPSKNLWQSYRDTKISTFYYVLDKTRDLDDPLHIVVVDSTEDGYELTDANNRTNDIDEFGDDADEYFIYLRSLGVNNPEDIFINKEPDEEEIKTKELIGQKNPNLDWFKKLDYDHKMRYIGRGHLLSDEQFNYLWGLFETSDGAFELLKKYVDTGIALPEKQFNVLVGNE